MCNFTAANCFYHICKNSNLEVVKTACQKKENILYKNENEKVSIVGIPGDWYYCQSPK